MAKIKMWLNASDFPYKGESNGLPSLTRPDESLSPREILRRYASGIPVTGGRMPVFDEQDDLPDINTLDLSEIEEKKEELKELLSNEAKRKAEIAKKKAEEAEKKKQEELYSKWEKERGKGPENAKSGIRPPSERSDD